MKPSHTARHAQRRRRLHIAEPLDTSHWPRPHACARCRLNSAYALPSGIEWCTSIECDPAGEVWRTLDAYYRDRAKAEPRVEINPPAEPAE